MISTFSIIQHVAAQKSFYDFKVETITGDSISLSEFKGKKILVVNTASKCGFTPQYEDLEKLYETYKDDDFVIIGFPANNFLHQEPGSNEEIAKFCKMNYGVTFPMMAKISVKGKDMHPLYEWLTTKKENGVLNTKISWNFQKFLIDKNGKLIKTLPPKTKPMDEEIVEWIKRS
ncbi:glutathione peroxidase [Saccharicrinis sp. FJH54]|uniref:glutathione peroxidase n=1 Tax=Saccharicrinis sp. FJH54 TaxID=3344665 RepID=UPI0035D46F8A